MLPPAALGITDEVELAGARGSKKKKSKQLGVDFFVSSAAHLAFERNGRGSPTYLSQPTLGPVAVEEVAAVVNATRQASTNERILPMLLSRIQLTSDASVNRAFVQMHGLVLVAGLLDEWRDNKEIVTLILGCLVQWPLLVRNKIEDLGLDQQVQSFCKSEDAETAAIANALDSLWKTLEVGYRIAKRDGVSGTPDAKALMPRRSRHDFNDSNTGDHSFTQQFSSSLNQGLPPPALTSLNGVASALSASFTGPSPSTPSTSNSDDAPILDGQQRAEAPKRSLQDIIAGARRKELQRREDQQKEAEIARARAMEAAAKVLRKQKRSLPTDADRSRKRRRKENSRHSSDIPPEKRLQKLVGTLVVSQMSKSKKYFEKESFKRHAKEVSQLRLKAACNAFL